MTAPDSVSPLAAFAPTSVRSPQPEAEHTPNSLRRRAESEPGEPRDAPSTLREVLRSPGQPLDPPTRAWMENHLGHGHDFSRVRVHVGELAARSAQAVHAQAYTVGQHIVFGAGRFAPNSQPGRELLAHELTHTLQNEISGLPEEGALRVSPPGREESEAEQAARAVRPGEERVAEVRPGKISSASGSIHLRPNITFEAGVNLEIKEDGQVTLSFSGPEVPAVGSSAIGVRRMPEGSYKLVAGGKSKLVAPTDIPEEVRRVISQANKPGQGAQEAGFRFPTCQEMQLSSRARMKTYDEYRAGQALTPDLYPLARPLYEFLVEVCKPMPMEKEAPNRPEAPEKPGMGDFPTSTLPQDTEMA